MPICTKCSINKSIEEFHKDKRKKSGINSRCKKCIIEIIYDYRKRNPDKFKKTKSKQTKEYFREYHKTRSIKFPELVKEIRKKSYNKHLIKRRKIIKDYKKKHKIRINEKARIRRQNDPNFCLVTSLRSRLSESIKKAGGNKNCTTFNLIGCSPKELKIHLESLFLPEMSWGNYGKNGWNVDHIKPCASFNLIDPEQQKLCFHYTNLRPMWESDNFSKGSLYNGIRHRYKN